MNGINRKLKTWDFSSRFLVRKNIVDLIYRNDSVKYSKELKNLGVWTREYITDLGPTFVKLGQSLSTRTDLFPETFVRELEYLQDSVTPIDPSEIDSLIVTELKEPINEVFKSFEYSPRKCASLGQVHVGILNSGVKVAVKIQRPGIRGIITEDVNTINEIITFLDFIGLSTGQSSKDVFLEAKEKLFEELDYLLEADNAILFRKMLGNTNDVVVPRVFKSKSTSKILIMEWIAGIKITDLSNLNKYSIDSKELSKRFLKLFITQVTDYGIFHADPHPGNVSIDRSGKIILYDYGLVIKIPANIRDRTPEIISLLFQRDTRKLVDLFIELGIIIPGSNKYDIISFFDSIIDYLQKVKTVNSESKNYILQRLAEQKPFVIPGSFIFLGKTISIIEGICIQLDPEFNFIDYLSDYSGDYSQTLISFLGKDNMTRIAISSMEMPTKIEELIENIESQKIDNNIKLNKLEMQNDYILIFAFLMESSSQFSEYLIFFIIFYFFIKNRKNY